MLLANVAIPVTFNVSLMLVTSNSVLPSTSKSPLASMLLANVAIPVTFKVSLMFVISNSVVPSTSRFPFTSSKVPTVAIPVIFQFLAVASSYMMSSAT